MRKRVSSRYVVNVYKSSPCFGSGPINFEGRDKGRSRRRRPSSVLVPRSGNPSRRGDARERHELALHEPGGLEGLVAPTTGSRYVAPRATRSHNSRSVCGPRSKAAKSLAVTRYAARVRTIGCLRTSEISRTYERIHASPRKSAGFRYNFRQL